MKKTQEMAVKSSKEMLDVQMLPWPAGGALKSVINDILSTKCTHRLVWAGIDSCSCLISHS